MERNLQVLDWFMHHHPEMRMIGRMHHYACASCGGRLGRSGHYSVESNHLRCFQPACEFGGGWHVATRYIQRHDAPGLAGLGLRPLADWNPATPRARGMGCKLPEGFTPLDRGTGQAGAEARRYMEGRGLDVPALAAKGVGYIPTPTRWFYNIIFPWKDEAGVLRYYQGRDYSNLLFNTARWKFPALSEVGCSAADMLYNQSKLLDTGDLWVMEGVMDALTMEGVGVPGKSLSPHHASLLQQSLATRLIIGFDEGAWLDVLNAAEKLQGGPPVYGAVVVGEGNYKGRKKDANALGVERMLEMELVRLDTEALARERLSVRFDGEWTYRGLTGVSLMW